MAQTMGYADQLIREGKDDLVVRHCGQKLSVMCAAQDLSDYNRARLVIMVCDCISRNILDVVEFLIDKMPARQEDVLRMLQLGVTVGLEMSQLLVKAYGELYRKTSMLISDKVLQANILDDSNISCLNFC